jgi:hypothetical protein
MSREKETQHRHSLPIAGDDTLLQLAPPPRVGRFQTTRSVSASIPNATPAPSTT